MQYEIPFIESLMPPEIAREYSNMKEDLPDPLQIPQDKMLPIARAAIQRVRKSMEFLKKYCEDVPFKDVDSEILFFRTIKPHFHALLIYWMAVFDLELKRPVGGKKHETKFLKKNLDRLYHFFESHTDFYKYYRSGRTDLDRLYFVRNVGESIYPSNPHFVEINPVFSTSYDFIVAKLIANDLIRQHLSMALSSLHKKESFIVPGQDVVHRLRWTASKTGLVELIYALQSGGVFNNGQAVIKEIASVFQEQFDTDLVNYYHTFNEIRLRKKNRTAFLDQLRENVLQKMNALDVRK